MRRCNQSVLSHLYFFVGYRLNVDHHDMNIAIGFKLILFNLSKCQSPHI